ncbi:MAG: metal ABC transporter substrate-binding protein [Marmoricola sp.]
MPRRPLTTALVLAVLLGCSCLAGCAGLPRPGAGGRAHVVTAFYPLQFVAQRIVGAHAGVTNLTQPGVEPHDLTLTVRQTALLSAADVGLYEHGLQPAVDRAMQVTPPRRSVDVADVVRLRPPPSSQVETTADDLDPHFWQDPVLLARVARAFAATMIATDPAHAAAYRRNGRHLQRDLAALDRDYRTGLASCRIRTVVVSHDAFEYLGRRYHLRIEPIAGISPDAEPSARHLAQLAQLIRRLHVTTVFSERLASPALARSLAGDVGVRTAVLDPIEGLSSADPDATYLTLMRANLAALRTAGDCS